jgi:hypothetical protein
MVDRNSSLVPKLAHPASERPSWEDSWVEHEERDHEDESQLLEADVEHGWSRSASDYTTARLTTGPARPSAATMMMSTS